MPRLFEKTYPQPGSAPGHGMHTPQPEHAGEAAIAAWVFRDGRLDECDPDQALRAGAPADTGEFLWLHLQGRPAPGQLRQLGEAFGLHPLALEDVRHHGQRPKLDYFDDHVVVVLGQPRLNGQAISLDQVNLFIGGNFVISVHSGEHDPFAPVRARMQGSNRNFRQYGAPYLGYALIDVVIDRAFPLMEHLGERIEDLEEAVLERAERDTLGEIHHLRRELLVLRRQLWPTRDVLTRLMREDTEPFGPEMNPWLRDVHDHTIQIMDLLESYREMAASLIEAYLSALNQRSNEVIRVLTIIATIFIPLTFIVGVYGMNFEHPESPWSMPELYTYYGYPVLLAIMAAIVAAMLYLFRRRGWL